MDITEKANERFCKDLNLPIKLFKEPYFSERLALYDFQFNCVEKYKKFCDIIEDCGGEQQYFEMYNRVKDAAILYLNNNPYMQYFATSADFNKFCIANTNFPKSSIYHQDNDGKCFISFDMKKGNFTALRHFDKRIVDEKDTYEEFLGKFTNNSHLLQSKYVRQVIFGNVNPRRQTSYEQYLMDKTMNDVLRYFSKPSICYFSTDEIVVNINKGDVVQAEECAKLIVDNSIAQNIDIRGEAFALYKVNGISDGYIKQSLADGQIDIKCVDSIAMPFLLRKLKGETYKENDAVFMFNDTLAKIIEMPDIQISKNITKFIDTMHKDGIDCKKSNFADIER